MRTYVSMTVAYLSICLGLVTHTLGAVLFSDDFEDDVKGGAPDSPPWNANQQPENSVIDIVDSTLWPNDSQAVHVIDTSTNNSTAVRFRASPITNLNADLVTASFDVYLDYPTKLPGHIYIELEDNGDRPVRSVGLVEKGEFLTKTWHHCDLIVNFSGSATTYVTGRATTNTLNHEKYDLWLDGKRVTNGGGTTPGSYVDGIDGFTALSWSGNVTEFLIDNVVIRDTPYVYEDILGQQTVDAINDDFDDDNLGSNASGMGHGFVKLDGEYSTFNESASESAVRFDVASGSWTRRTVASRDEFLLGRWNRHFAWYTDNVTVSNGLDAGDARLLCAVVADDIPQTVGRGIEPWVEDEGGFWVQLDFTDAGTSNTVRCYLYASDDSNVPFSQSELANLGTFTFDHDDGEALDVFLSLQRLAAPDQAFAYSLSVVNDSGVVGALSGTTDTGITKTDLLADELADGAWVGFGVNNRNGGMVSIDLERITVSGTPQEGTRVLVR